MIRNIQARHLLGGAIAVLLLALAVLLIANIRKAPPVEEAVSAVSDADLVLQTFEYTETRGGRRQWSIVADSAGYRQAAGETLIENLQVTVFSESDQASDLVLRARNGRVDVDARNVEVWDEVVVTAGDDYRLVTDRLSYNGEQGIITTSSPVRITSQGFDVRGRGLRLEVATRNLEILSDVQASISPERLEGPDS